MAKSVPLPALLCGLSFLFTVSPEVAHLAKEIHCFGLKIAAWLGNLRRYASDAIKS
jgi:hypothetical protein